MEEFSVFLEKPSKLNVKDIKNNGVLFLGISYFLVPDEVIKSELDADVLR